MEFDACKKAFGDVRLKQHNAIDEGIYIFIFIFLEIILKDERFLQLFV